MSDYTPPDISSLLGLIDTHLRWKDIQGKGDRQYIHYHPSEWGYCLRKQQYKHFVQMGYVKIEEIAGHQGQLVRTFDIGHSAHHRWQDEYFGNMNILRGRWKCQNLMCFAVNNEGVNRFAELKPEHIEKMLSGKTRVYGMDNPIGEFKPEQCICGCKKFTYCETPVKSEELNFAGNADIILDFSRLDPSRYEGVRKTFNIETLPKKHIVVDMKTMNDFSWKQKLMKTGCPKEYIIQVTIYAHILDAEYGVLIFENKNDSDLFAYKVERNDKIFNAVKQQAKWMIALAEKKLLPPPRPSDPSDRECSQCEFASLCHKSATWKDPKLDEKRKMFYGPLLG